MAALLAGCAGEPQTYTLDTGSERETVTVPKGTMTGAASVGDANALAKEIADSNNAAMAQFNRMGAQMSDLQSTENKELATSQAALEKLERLAAQQGTGSIRLFFAEGSAHLDQFQYERLVSFLDYLARESRGRNVILVSIGSASAVGPAAVNLRLSMGRSEAPLPVIDRTWWTSRTSSTRSPRSATCTRRKTRRCRSRSATRTCGSSPRKTPLSSPRRPAAERRAAQPSRSDLQARRPGALPMLVALIGAAR